MKFLLGFLTSGPGFSGCRIRADSWRCGVAGCSGRRRAACARCGGSNGSSMMPVRGAAQGIDVLQVEVERPGKHPLAILTHGTAAEAKDRATVTPWGFLPQAIWFARRGYVVLVVVRKGYGRSFGDQDGKFGGCRNNGQGSFVEAGEDSADDLRAAAKYAQEKLPEVDAGTIVSAGVSTGGFAQVALSADPPAGLKAAISFAGGRGGDGKEHNCDFWRDCVGLSALWEEVAGADALDLFGERPLVSAGDGA